MFHRLPTNSLKDIKRIDNLGNNKVSVVRIPPIDNYNFIKYCRPGDLMFTMSCKEVSTENYHIILPLLELNLRIKQLFKENTTNVMNVIMKMFLDADEHEYEYTLDIHKNLEKSKVMPILPQHILEKYKQNIIHDNVFQCKWEDYIDLCERYNSDFSFEKISSFVNFLGVVKAHKSSTISTKHIILKHDAYIKNTLSGPIKKGERCFMCVQNINFNPVITLTTSPDKQTETVEYYNPISKKIEKYERELLYKKIFTVLSPPQRNLSKELKSILKMTSNLSHHRMRSVWNESETILINLND